MIGRKRLTQYVSRKGPDGRLARGIVARACKSRGCQVEISHQWVDISRGDRVVRLAGSDLVHAPHVAGEFDVFFGAVTPDVVGGQAIVDFSVPKVHHYIPLDLELFIPTMQERIPVEHLYWAFSTPQVGDLVYDLGANIGVVTIALARRVGASGRVVSFEPDPGNAAILRRNITAAGLTNVTVVEAAVAGENGTAQFVADGSIGSGLESARAESLLPGSPDRTVTVPVLTLPTAFAEHGVPSWIKMDIEGAEVAALQAARHVLATSHPMLAIETDHIVGRTTTAADVEQVLRAAGYAVTTARSHGTQMTWTVPQRPGAQST